MRSFKFKEYVLICVELLLMSAQYLYPQLPPLVAGILFWAGALGLFALLLLKLKEWLQVNDFSSFIPLSRGKWPDFEKWDQREVFQLYEAACLWFNREPSLPLFAKAKAKFRQWKDMRDVLPVERSKTIRAAVERAFAFAEGGNPITVHTEISREVLKGLAEEDRRRPLFLYQEDRDR